MTEVLPVAQFGGRRGWVMTACCCMRRTPDDFNALTDAARGYGRPVGLDIVLNHVGPQGNCRLLLSPDFFHPERMTPWGTGIAHDVGAVRHYLAEAPLYWLQEYNLDGLRFDALDQIEDTPDPHILMVIARHIRAEVPEHPTHLTTEDCRNVIFLPPRDAGMGARQAASSTREDRSSRRGVDCTVFTNRCLTRGPRRKLATAWSATRGAPVAPLR